ncbi:SDR family oxidoreductase [Curtobacterium sp. MCJR17_020]|uniref:SDR family NAD(P)-dependent oxidoreductase n=1 Tax=Curtobacterium sp. MCJR17_020 TaxID=2175619 RepID=UPI0021AD0A18|nr:SDR family oxidoreductase [Curtobacterium sp. MCJR17_020]WIE72027.1 SDR family oxidoreductase [Curtobacterium sp. MCJR17_020]
MSLQQLFGLDGRTALVTGGSSGIGQAIAVALADAGSHVLVAARTAATIDATVATIRQAGGSADGIVADLSSRAGAHALADAAGDVDVLVNSAGINLRPPMADLHEDTWDATMAVNLDAPFVLGQRLAPGMTARGHGRIISISSQQAHRPFAASGAYGVSKAGRGPAAGSGPSRQRRAGRAGGERHWPGPRRRPGRRRGSPPTS